jgi:hypothetical protein
MTRRYKAPPKSGPTHINLKEGQITLNKFVWIGGIEMQISVEQFKTDCLKIMTDVQKHHSEIIITKLGKPIAKVVPQKINELRNLCLVI